MSSEVGLLFPNYLQKERNMHFFMVCELMSGSCHLDSMSNDEFSVECLFWFFQPTWKSDLKVVQITKNYIFWVNAPLQYLECAPDCKTWPQLKKDNKNKYLTFITNFDIRRAIQMTWTRHYSKKFWKSLWQQISQDPTLRM